MKSLTENLKKIRDILNSTSANGRVYHYTKPKKELKSWIVWQEDGEDMSLNSDNHKQHQQVNGSIDLYTKAEYDPLVDEVQDALDKAEHVGWRLNIVDYEDETTLIHYQWEFYIS